MVLALRPESRAVFLFIELDLCGVFYDLDVAVCERLIQEDLGEGDVADVQRVRDADEAAGGLAWYGGRPLYPCRPLFRGAKKRAAPHRYTAFAGGGKTPKGGWGM